MSAVSSPKSKSENVFDMKLFRAEKQLQCRASSDERLKLTGIVGEIVVVVIRCIVVWETEAGIEFRTHSAAQFDFTGDDQSMNCNTHLSQDQYL